MKEVDEVPYISLSSVIFWYSINIGKISMLMLQGAILSPDLKLLKVLIRKQYLWLLSQPTYYDYSEQRTCLQVYYLILNVSMRFLRLLHSTNHIEITISKLFHFKCKESILKHPLVTNVFVYRYFCCNFSADAQYSVAVVNTNVIVQASGEVLWPSAGIFKSVCGMDLEYFPFDVQTCNLKFASWAYDGSQVCTIKSIHVMVSKRMLKEFGCTIELNY